MSNQINYMITFLFLKQMVSNEEKLNQAEQLGNLAKYIDILAQKWSIFDIEENMANLSMFRK